MTLADLHVGRWFYDLELGCEGRVLHHGVGGTYVALRVDKPIVIAGETVGVRKWERMFVTSGWELQPGRLPKNPVAYGSEAHDSPGEGHEALKTADLARRGERAVTGSSA